MREGAKKRKKTLSRYGFEQLIGGYWQEKAGDRYRENGEFRTFVVPGQKCIQNGNQVLKARTWRQLAQALELPIDY